MVANQIATGSEETEYKLTHTQTSKTLELETPGFFVVATRKKMTDTKSKRQAEFVRQHTLTEADLRKIIAEKLERAKAYNNAKRKREVLQESR